MRSTVMTWVLFGSLLGVGAPIAEAIPASAPAPAADDFGESDIADAEFWDDMLLNFEGAYRAQMGLTASEDAAILITGQQENHMSGPMIWTAVIKRDNGSMLRGTITRDGRMLHYKARRNIRIDLLRVTIDTPSTDTTESYYALMFTAVGSLDVDEPHSTEWMSYAPVLVPFGIAADVDAYLADFDPAGDGSNPGDCHKGYATLDKDGNNKWRDKPHWTGDKPSDEDISCFEMECPPAGDDAEELDTDCKDDLLEGWEKSMDEACEDLHVALFPQDTPGITPAEGQKKAVSAAEFGTKLYKTIRKGIKLARGAGVTSTAVTFPAQVLYDLHKRLKEIGKKLDVAAQHLDLIGDAYDMAVEECCVSCNDQPSKAPPERDGGGDGPPDSGEF